MKSKEDRKFEIENITSAIDMVHNYAIRLEQSIKVLQTEGIIEKETEKELLRLVYDIDPYGINWAEPGWPSTYYHTEIDKLFEILEEYKGL